MKTIEDKLLLQIRLVNNVMNIFKIGMVNDKICLSISGTEVLFREDQEYNFNIKNRVLSLTERSVKI